MRRSLGWMAVAASLSLVTGQTAGAQEPPPEYRVFGHTLYQGSGFINTPHAFVNEGAFFASGSLVGADDFDPANPESFTQASAAIALGRVIEVGGTIHDTDTFSGFAKLQMVRQHGPFPAIAAGVQNVTNKDIGRFGFHPDPFYDDFIDRMVIYGVATYVVGPGDTPWPSWVVFSGGWGSGIFEKDNPALDSDDRTGGFFGALALDFQAARNAMLRAALEWDGFDLNVAATAWLGGLELTLGILSADEDDAPDRAALPPGTLFDPQRDTPQGFFYNQIKPFVSLTLDLRALGEIPWVWGSGDE